jgi:hypothetical protein
METVQEVTRTDTGRSIVTVNEEEVRNHLDEMVRASCPLGEVQVTGRVLAAAEGGGQRVGNRAGS